MSNELLERRLLPAAAAVPLLLISVPLCAQSSDRRVEEVIVTGSHIQGGTPEDSAVPVEVFSAEDLENLGRPSNMELIKTMSEVGTVAGEADRANFFPIGAASVNLRNLGSRFTTVIFNGRRFPEQSASIGRFNNINWIPNAAIGSIEVLKEGGAATYGADAIGGVVNYITHRNFDGLEVAADYRYIDDSDGDYDADVLWGTKFDRGNVLVSSGYQHRSTLDALDRRRWAQRDYLENNSGWSANGSPGSYVFQGAGFAAITPGAAGANRYTGNQQMGATGVVRDPQCTALGGFAGWSATSNPVCYFQQIQFEQLVNESDQYHVYGELNFDLTDTLEFHGEGMYLRQSLPSIPKDPSDGPGAWPLANTSSGRQTVGASPAYFVPGSNPAVADFLNNFRNADGSLAFTPQQIAAITSSGRVGLLQQQWRPFGNGGNPLSGAYDVQENDIDMFRFTGALSGGLPQFWGTDLEWEVALTYSHVTSRIATRDMLIDRLQAALNGFGGPDCNGIQAGQPGSSGCYWFNPFASAIAQNIYTGEVNPGFVPALQNHPDMVRWLYVPIDMRTTYENYTLDPVIRGRLGWDLPGGPVAVAVGGQFRWGAEEFKLNDLSNRDLNPCATIGVTACPEAIRTGPLVFARPLTVFGRTENLRRIYPVVAAFGELQLPLLESVNLQLAGRYEKFFSDVTDKDNTVFVPAGAIKWQPLSWLALRASAGKTFSQVNPPKDDGPTLRNSLPTSSFANVGSVTNGTNYTTFTYDNVDVEPEHGSYLDLGFIVQAGNFAATVDYFDIRIDNYARRPFASALLPGLVVAGQAPAVDNLVDCSSPLLAQQASLRGHSFVELNGPCVQGQSRLNSPSGEGGLGGGQMHILGDTNGGQLKTTGIDVTASYGFENVLGGTLRPSVDASYILEWTMGDYSILGIPVSKGYDAKGFRNTSPGRTGGQVVPEYRAGFGLMYSRGRHMINATARYIPSVINENPGDFDASNDQNANIGNTGGVVTSGTGAGTSCTVPAAGLVGNVGTPAAGAGTGQFGGGSVSATGVPVANVVGFCGAQNTSILSGRKIDSYAYVDLTYRLGLPNETDVSLTVYNLLDADPSFSREVLSYDSGFGSPLGRNFKLTLKKRF